MGSRGEEDSWHPMKHLAVVQQHITKQSFSFRGTEWHAVNCHEDYGLLGTWKDPLLRRENSIQKFHTGEDLWLRKGNTVGQDLPWYLQNQEEGVHTQSRLQMLGVLLTVQE